MPDDLSISSFSRHGASHPNPMYNFLTGFVPRKLKDLFRWAEYIYTDSPAIFAALQKLAAYPVTEINVECTEPARKAMWEGLLKKQLKARSVAIATALDRRIYGNSFISMYKPFDRFLVCDSCKARTNIQQAAYTLQLKTLRVKYRCAACEKNVTGTILDVRAKDKKRLSLIRWDPKLIDIDYNPLTGKSKYYYTIPNDLKVKVQKGNRHLINTIPMGFLKAIQKDQVFEFADGQIYHMKMPAPAGIDAQWGMPPLLCTIKLFFYAAVLRKANEAIALDHIVPFRVLHPAPISGTADPASMINLGRWQEHMAENVKMWRRDPLHIMFAPVALGVTMMGGQGRSLLTLGEVKEAEDNIIAGLGVPREFVYGGLTLAGSGVSLRMLENQLETDSAEQDEQLEWIVEQASDVLNWKPVPCNFIPFKFIDDVEQKQALMALQQVLGGPMANDTLLSSYGIDLNKERDKKFNEQIADTREQLKLQRETEKIMTSASQTAAAEAQSGQGLGYNPLAVVQYADQMAQQLAQMDPGTRRSHMDQLSQEDPVMYAVVKDRLETQASMARQQAVAQVQQGQQGVPAA